MEMVVGKEQSECGGKSQSAMEIYSLITFYESDFEKLKKQEGGKTPKKQQKWKPPQSGFYKINIDASFQAKSGKNGWDFVARGNNGEFLEGDVVT